MKPFKRLHSTFSDKIEKVDDIQISMNQKQISISGISYYTNTLEEFKREQSSVIAQSSASEKKLYSKSAGYFTSTYDGYEYLNYNNYVDVTVNDYHQLMSLTAMDIPDLYVGKIQNEPVWKYYSLISTEDASSLHIGSVVYLEFKSQLNEKFKVRTQV